MCATTLIFRTGSLYGFPEEILEAVLAGKRAPYRQVFSKPDLERRLPETQGASRAVVAFMKISKTWQEFQTLLNQHYPRYGDNFGIAVPLRPQNG